MVLLLHFLLAVGEPGGAPLAGAASLTIDFAQDELQGELDTALPASGRVGLASYLAALDEPYRGNDIDRLWDYTGKPSSSQFEWLVVAVDGACLNVARQGQVVPLPAGRQLKATFRAHIPHRYGPLGQVDGDLLLVAPLPFLVSSPEHPSRSRALAVTWKIALHTSGATKVLLEPKRGYSGDPSALWFAAAERGYHLLPAGLPESGPLAGQANRAILAPNVLPYHFGKGEDWPVGSTAEATLDQPARQELADTYQWIASALARFKVPAQRWLMGALRREPAVCAGDTLIVSRELFRVAPVESLLRFHRFGLARLALGCALAAAWQLSEEDADALGAFFARELYAESKGQKTEGKNEKNVGDVLHPLSFLPDVDSLIYEPQMPWPEVYFNAIDESSRGPPQPRTFFHNRPPGKILFEKLLDRLGPAETERLFLSALALHQGLAAETARRDKAAYQEIVDDFLGPYPPYDASFSVHGTTVQVHRVGAGANVREPLVVSIVDANGEHFSQKRLLSGSESEFDFPDATSPLKEVVLDPDHRVVERYLTAPDKDPRYNNSTHHHLRLTLGQLSGAYGTSESELTLGVDFILRREFDLANFFGFGAYYSPLGLGTSARYAYAFGRRIDDDRLAYRTTAIVVLDRFNQGFANAPHALYALSTAVSLAYDNRPSERTAMSGFAWNLHLDLALPVAGVEGSARPYEKFGGGLLYIAPVAYAQGLAIRLRADGSIGQVPLQDQYSVGGRFFARGYAQGDTVSPQRLIGSLEYRHELARGFRTNFLKGEFVDGLEGALFADLVATPSSLTDHGWWSLDRLFPDVGYGFRLLLDHAGVTPGVFAVDIGVPLKDMGKPGRAPVTVYLGFAQSFAEF